MTRELKAIGKEAFSRSFHSLQRRCKRCAEAGGAILSNGVNKYLLSSCGVLRPQFMTLVVTLCTSHSVANNNCTSYIQDKILLIVTEYKKYIDKTRHSVLILFCGA